MGDQSKDAVEIPYFVHEGVVSRMDKCNKRLLIALVVSLVVLLLNNAAWLAHNYAEHVNQIVIEEVSDD